MPSSQAGADAWAGGRSPFAIGSKKLGMWLFIASDSLTFATMLVVYTFLRQGSATWPAPFAFSPSIVFSTVMTLVLLSSSLTMVYAVKSMHAGDRARTVRWLGATMLGGAAFVGLHVTEWMHLIRDEKVTPGRTRGACRCSARRSSASPDCTCSTSPPAWCT